MELCMFVLWVLPIPIPGSETWNCACLYCEISPLLYLYQRHGTVHVCTVSSPHSYTCIRDMELCMFVLWVLPITIPGSETWNCACMYCEISPLLYLYQRHGTVHVCNVSSPHYYTCIRDMELCIVVLWVLPITIPGSEIWNSACL